MLRHVGPRELHPAGLRARLDTPPQPRERPPVVQSEDAQFDERLREGVGDLGFVELPSLRRKLVQIVEEHFVHDLFLERERRAPFVRERRVRDRPAPVELAHQVVAWHEDLVEEHFVELRLSGDLDQRAHVDPLRLHVDDEVRDAPMPGRLRIRAREADPPPGVARIARPHLLAADQPTVVDRHRPRRQRREIAARVRLAEQLAPDLRGGEDPGEPSFLLVVAAVGEEGGTGEVDADPVDGLRGASAGVLHVEDRNLHRGSAAPAVLGRPVNADPASGRQLRLPPSPPGDLVVDGLEGGRVLDVRGQPLPHLRREGALVVGEAEVHYRSQKRSRL
jgi:hypothetical protein